jgi:hypothetical protein
MAGRVERVTGVRGVNDEGVREDDADAAAADDVTCCECV